MKSVTCLKNKQSPFVILFLVTILLFTAALFSQDEQTGKEIFDRARLNLFDQKYEAALKDLEYIIATYPGSNTYDVAHFYKAKCLEKLQRLSEALEIYHIFMKISQNNSLKEDAAAAIIDIDFALYSKGQKKYLQEIKTFLASKEWTARHYAAFKLSYAKDKKVAALAIPVLQEIVEAGSGDSDQELVDRAKIALMRIDPEVLKQLPNPKQVEAKLLHIRIYDKISKKETLSLHIPFVLARLALDSIPEKEKNALKIKGYNLDNILQTLIKNRDLFKFETESSVVKIWID